MKIKMNDNIIFTLTITLLLTSYYGECRRDKIKLKDIEVLTLEAGKWTTGRRSSSVPQLKCVSGLCQSLQPSVVQCYNRGSDGVDVQWECKAEMNSKYKFGKIEVTCEGYDYADDPYVLLGSCGLEYSIDSDNSNTGHSNGYSNGYSQTQNTYRQNDYKLKNSFSFGYILGVIAIIFIVYYTCIRTPDRMRTASAPQQPPPPGFRSNLFDDDSAHSSNKSSYRSDSTNTTNGGVNPGFWSGLMTGGTLGYLFGGTRTNYYRDRTSYWDTPSYGSGSSFFNSGSGTTSSSTKTSSGFGGTKRR